MIAKFYEGMPAKCKGMLGKLFSQSVATWVNDMPSLVYLVTPHGSVVKGGVIYCNDLDMSDAVRLNKYESMTVDPYYGFTKTEHVENYLRINGKMD